ncbi:MAG: YXWGXW repeat-containing protein [Candidatus Eisenbacteria bacterium]
MRTTSRTLFLSALVLSAALLSAGVAEAKKVVVVKERAHRTHVAVVVPKATVHVAIPAAPVKVVVAMPAPRSGWGWVSGHWDWRPVQQRWVWIEGHWVKK